MCEKSGLMPPQHRARAGAGRHTHLAAPRIARIREACSDLFGHTTSRWRVIRTSNTYVFRDPQAVNSRGVPSKSGNQTKTQPRCSFPVPAPAISPDSPLARFAAVIAAKNGIEQ